MHYPSETEKEKNGTDHGEMKPILRVALTMRNVMVAIASVLFLISIFTKRANITLTVIAYLCGAMAYFCEFLHLTEGFKVKIPHEELFMVYCFAPLYVLLGLSYIFYH